MATAKKKTDVSEASDGALIKVFRIDNLSISIFARDREVKGEKVTFYSASLSRSYTDAKGERKYTKNFDSEDLGRVESLAKQASEFIQSRRGLTTEPQED